MNTSNNLKSIIGETDIYLLDQIMKGRYKQEHIILDAGCGDGRNMHWFLQNNFEIYAIDINAALIDQLKAANPTLAPGRLKAVAVEKTPFPDNHFDHIICSAVLHFANDTDHFNSMFGELVRILKHGGSIFIRMTSDIGIEKNIQLLADGVYIIPDGSNRFLLTKPLLAAIMQLHNLSFIEPLKTVNVDDVRCMSTLLLQKD